MYGCRKSFVNERSLRNPGELSTFRIMTKQFIYGRVEQVPSRSWREGEWGFVAPRKTHPCYSCGGTTVRLLGFLVMTAATQVATSVCAQSSVTISGRIDVSVNQLRIKASNGSTHSLSA
jgi:hypothetical protein